MTQLGIDVVDRMIARTKDHSEALRRTNLAVRLWLRRCGPFERGGCEPASPTTAFLVWNHAIQAFYEQYGIDVIPGAALGMYPYFCSFERTKSGCLMSDGPRFGSMTNNGVQIAPEHRDDRDPLRTTVDVKESIVRGEDPLWVIERAVRVAVGGKFPKRCPGTGCRHKEDAHVYRDVYQALALLLATGRIDKAVLDEDEPEYFRAGSILIHRRTGELVEQYGKQRRLSFGTWNRGDARHALEYFDSNAIGK